MHADIHEGSELCDVRDDAFQNHADMQVGDFMDRFGKRGHLEFTAWISAGTGKFMQRPLILGPAVGYKVEERCVEFTECGRLPVAGLD